MKTLFVFIGMILALFFVWATTGGPERAISQGGWFLTQPSPTESSKTYGPAPDKSPEENRSSAEKLSREEIEERAKEIKKEAEKLQEKINTSKYKDKIYIDNFPSGVDERKTQKEYLLIKAKRSNKENISITGWQLKSSASGKRIEIKEATRIPEIPSLSRPKEIILKPGEEAMVITGSSPIGESFKLSKCIGYLSKNNDFYYSLSGNCPRPKNRLKNFEDRHKLTEQDLDYIRGLSNCETIISPPYYLSDEAREFLLDNANYAGCVENHKNDGNFFRRQWRIYLNRNEEMWRNNFEEILLIDDEGQPVDIVEFD